MKGSKTAALISSLGILNSLLLLFWIAGIYSPIMAAKMAQGHWYEANTVKVVFLVLGWLALASGALWAVSLFGFLKDKAWAWLWGLAAAGLQILSGFFPFIPAMSVHIISKTLISFVLALIFWFLMMGLGNVGKKSLWIAFLAGLAYIFSFIDGVGSIARYQLTGKGLLHGVYGMCQMVNWGAAAAFFVFILAAARKKSWTVPLGVFAASLSILAGFPVGIVDMMRIGRFSLFLISPIFSSIFLIVLLLSQKALGSDL